MGVSGELREPIAGLCASVVLGRGPPRAPGLDPILKGVQPRHSELGVFLEALPGGLKSEIHPNSVCNS